MIADTVTLTGEEFKTIHNALWQIQYGNGPDVEAQVEIIREALKGCYEQDQKAFRIKNDHYNHVRRELGLDAIWSIYEVNDLSQPHPYKDVVTVTYESHWGEDERMVVRNIMGNTYAALYVAANACIRDSGDSHHLFIEGFRQVDNTLVLFTGS